MARLNAPRPVGTSPARRPDPAPQDKPAEAMNTGWPFAIGSQNRLDETAAHWPRPSAKPASGMPQPQTK